jgi:hypothetical protein
MMTRPDEFQDLKEARLAKYLSAEDFEKMQKAKYEAFVDVIKFFAKCISRL